MGDVNQYSRDGGDTAPGTKEQIKERNDAADKLAAASVERAQAIRDLHDEHDSKYAEAVKAYEEAVGNPNVVEPSKAQDEKPKGRGR